MIIISRLAYSRQAFVKTRQQLRKASIYNHCATAPHPCYIISVRCLERNGALGNAGGSQDVEGSCKNIKNTKNLVFLFYITAVKRIREKQ